MKNPFGRCRAVTLKEIIRKAVDELVKKGKEEFTTKEIYREAMKIDPGADRAPHQ